MRALAAHRVGGAALWAAAYPRALCTAVRLAPTGVDGERRASRRRYAAANTRGRVGQAKALVDSMKTKSTAEAKAFFDALLPRDKLDVMRLLHQRRQKRRSYRAASKLAKFYSVPFEKNYFFPEEDLVEESTLGRGPGGQATNRRMQTAIVKHTPTGIIVKFSRFPSLWLNRRAARELLHLRLEEHLLGPASRLGKARAIRERRQKRRTRTVTYLTAKGTRLQTREARRCHWRAFLCGEAPLPSAAMAEIGASDASTVPLTVADLFGNECHSWWPKLKAAVDSTQGADAELGAGAAAVPPLLMQYLFPLAYGDSSRAERAEIAACRSSDVARANVARAFGCFCELFGLRLRRQTSSLTPEAAAPRVVLERDGLNWMEHRARMTCDGALTPVARVCWPHVYVCLRELGFLAEARAIVVFLKREAKAAAASPAQGAWAAEALQCLTEASRRCKPTAAAAVAAPADAPQPSSPALPTAADA